MFLHAVGGKSDCRAITGAAGDVEPVQEPALKSSRGLEMGPHSVC